MPNKILGPGDNHTGNEKHKDCSHGVQILTELTHQIKLYYNIMSGIKYNMCIE